MIVQRLLEIQERDGYLRREAMEALAGKLGVRLRHLHEVASFFPHFRLKPPPAAEVQVCRDMACHLHGSMALTEELKALLRGEPGGQVHVGGASCLGQCDRPPAVRINDRDCSLRDPAAIAGLVQDLVAGRASADDIPLAEPSHPRSWVIDFYQGDPSYRVLGDVVRSRAPEKVLQALDDSGLLGLGGPGQRAGKKWREVLQAPGERKYVVCNGDESEPGTFKDRELLTHAPHLVVEGMAIAAWVVGASQGYVYIRHEFERPIAAMRAAIGAAYRQKVLGRPDPITGRAFDLEVFISPGGYICGEQTALIEAIEGHRAEPRNRPPELQVKGLFGQPTLLNNVETLAWVPSIVRDGGVAAYLADGVNGGTGRRFFSISGDVKEPGVFEVPNGLTVRDLIERAGGLSDGLKALATSGPSAGFLPRRLPVSALPRTSRGSLQAMGRPLAGKLSAGTTALDVLDLELDVHVFRALNLMLGAGIVVYGEQRDMADQARNCSRFFGVETCGKCVPCRLGTRRLVELAEELCSSRGDAAVLSRAGGLAGELQAAMTQASICGLGQVAANPLNSALAYFRSDFESPPERRADG